VICRESPAAAEGLEQLGLGGVGDAPDAVQVVHGEGGVEREGLGGGGGGRRRVERRRQLLGRRLVVQLQAAGRVQEVPPVLAARVEQVRQHGQHHEVGQLRKPCKAGLARHLILPQGSQES